MPFVLTLLAGIMVGLAAMRIWQATQSVRPPATVSVPPEPVATSPAKPLAINLKRLSPRIALLTAAAVAVLAIGVKVLQGPDDGMAAPSGMAATTPVAPGGKQQSLADVDSMIAMLAGRLKTNPQDGEGQRMLGWSYVMTGKPDQAIAPYGIAVRLLPNQANVHEGYGEALVGVAKGTVTPEAKAAFARALALDPAEPRARYFLAMWQAQHGEERPALDKWIALANSGPADAPWQVDLRHQIDATAKKLGIDVAPRLKSPPPAAALAGALPTPAPAPVTGALPALDNAAMAAGQTMPDADRQAMITAMVDKLANRLKANPNDASGWISLLRSRMVQKQADQAASDLATARKALSGDDLARVNAAARTYGVRGAQ
jgi:cytochrome c-type biogenesis protein CcmH